MISLVLHLVASFVAFLFWPRSEPRLEEGAINAVLMQVEKPKTKRLNPVRRAQIQKPTEATIQTTQPNLKILTSNAPPTERGIASAARPTKFSTFDSLELGSGLGLTSNAVTPQPMPQIEKVIRTPVKPEPIQKERPKSRLVKFIEKQEGPQRIIYCVDVSSSMLGLNPRKLQKIIAIMQDSLEFLEPHDQFNIMTFSGKIEFYRADFIAVTDDTLSEAIAYLGQAKPIKSSRYADKDMLEALLEAQPRHPTITVLFSDGILTSGMPNPNTIEQYTTGNVRLFTMATEMAEDFPGAVLLGMLADKSHGEFWLVETGQ